MKTAKKKEKNDEITEDKYTKNQIINSKTYVNNRDLLNALLSDNKTYSKSQVNEIIENFKKGKVK